MQFPILLGLLTIIISATNAVPTSTKTTALPAKKTIVPPARYYLKTKVINAYHPDKEGLYVSGYHTGAGTNDIVLGAIGIASIGFLNHTYQQFDYNTEFPWGLELGGDTNYAAWEFASIDATSGQGSGGFFFNSTGLQQNSDQDGFAGWLACDWWHGLPQLFWLYEFYNFPIPSSCAKVQLLPIAVPKS